MGLVALLKSITEMCEEEENKSGNEESWETVFRPPKPRDLTLARPIRGGHMVLQLGALLQISLEQPCLLLTPPALLFRVAPML